MIKITSKSKSLINLTAVISLLNVTWIQKCSSSDHKEPMDKKPYYINNMSCVNKTSDSSSNSYETDSVSASSSPAKTINIPEPFLEEKPKPQKRHSSPNSETFTNKKSQFENVKYARDGIFDFEEHKPNNPDLFNNSLIKHKTDLVKIIPICGNNADCVRTIYAQINFLSENMEQTKKDQNY